MEDLTDVKVVRSARRRKTVSATVENGIMVLRVPAHFTASDELHWAEKMRGKLLAKRARRQAGRSCAALEERARRLARDYFGELQFTIAWSSRQQKRWGSCTPAHRTIRLSENLRELPDYVIDYVIVHELAHLLVADHSPEFWGLVARYPLTERARGYLEGLVAGQSRPSLAP